MNVLIIEDELHNMRMLTDMLVKLRPNWNVVGQLDSVKQSVDFLSENPQPELILMDIQLSDGVCFSIFEQVEVRSSIIFTTAFDNYAIQAFKVNSIDYLLKPVKEADLEKALIKLEDLRQPPKPQFDYNEIVQAIKKGQKEYRKRFLISAGNKYYKLDTNEIACFTRKVYSYHPYYLFSQKSLVPSVSVLFSLFSQEKSSVYNLASSV